MRRCRVCKCTEDRACATNPPCGWEEQSLCTNCAAAINWLANWILSARNPYVGNLVREARLEAMER
jgi:hypothetical protein